MQKAKTKIKEIFLSLQGEGLFVGQLQLFIRFCKCNLACSYCDTDFSEKKAKTYDVDTLINEIKKYDVDIISFTGGEPLIDVDFLIELLPELKKLNKKIYLETNGTLVDELKKIIDYIDIISADIKIESATNQKNNFSINEKFIETALRAKKDIFIKTVFDKNISNYEIDEISKIVKKHNVELILQPKMPLEYDINIIEIYNKFYKKYKNIRLIPQTHKFLNII